MHRRPLAVLILLVSSTLPAAARVDRWTPIGPDAGIVLILAAAPSRPSTVYAALVSAAESQVARSLDGGASWELRAAIPDSFSDATALVVDPRLPDRIWAATRGGIFRSTDGGAHWARVRDVGTRTLAADPQAAGTIYAPYGDGPLQRSTDAGTSWRTLAKSPPEISDLVIDPAQPRSLYAATYLGFFLSRDGGASWRQSDQGLPSSPLIISLALDPHSPPAARTLYLSTFSSNPGTAVFRSGNGGERWTEVGQGTLGLTSRVAVDTGKGGAVWAVSDGEPFRSSDQGRTWSRAGAGLPPGAVYTVLPGATLLAGTAAGVFASADRGASWAPSSRGITAAGILGLALDPLRPLRLWTLDFASEVFRTTSGGGRWARLPEIPDGPVFGPLVSDPNRPGTLYAGLAHEIAYSTDAGNHWSVGSPLPCFQPSAIAVDPRDSSVVYAAGDPGDAGCSDPHALCGIFRSDDSGAHWSCTGGSVPEIFASLVVPDPVQAGAVYAVNGEQNLYRSTDRGGSWSFLSPQLGIRALAADSRVAGRLWAGGRYGVLRSDDGGVTWTPYGAGLPADANVPVVALALDPVDGNVAYAATTRNGVFRTTDAGATWTTVGPGLAGLNVGFLVLDPRSRTTLYAGTRERGVWKLQQSGD